MRAIGVDIGGTFTDLVLYDSEAGASAVHKVPSTPGEPDRAMVLGIGELCERAGITLADVSAVFHATTVATNAVLEHDGAAVGMITTRGFRDIVHIGRHQRPLHYSVMQEIPWQARPFVPRRHRKVVSERIVPPAGEVLTALDEDEVRVAARELRADGVEAVAICFLFSYLNPAHERRAAAIVREEMPGAFVTTSAEIVPQFREFERFTTACMSAFVGPKTGRYLDRLADALKHEGMRGDLHVMMSSGGLASVSAAAQRPVTLLLSGPAAGVLGGHWTGRLAGRRRLITFDVGGTSADIGLVTDDGVAEASARDTWVGGYPLLVPMLDVHTIGAGGGSIAFVDDAGAFRVGPRSAGAAPGPACYGRGGAEPTITDAQLVLGRIHADRFLGGRMGLRAERAHAAVERLAARLGLGPVDCAEGIVTIANANMARAIRSRTIEKGHDPREFALVAFGGAGPLHAAEVAQSLEIPEVLVPPHPGITSAAGLLTGDLRYDRMQTVFMVQGQVDAARLNRSLEELESELRGWLARDGVPEDEVEVVRMLDCRYVGQGYELRLVLDPSPFAQEHLDRFHALHEREYGHAFSDPIEVVNARVSAVGRRASPATTRAGAGDRDTALLGESECTFRVGGELRSLPTRFYDRHRLPVGEAVPGPAVFFHTDTTTLVPPGWMARAEAEGYLWLSASGSATATRGRRRGRGRGRGATGGMTAAPGTRVDPVTAAVIAGALDSIAVEMGHKLARMSFSSIIRESEDFGCVICDDRARQLCESSQSTPLQSGPIPGYVRGINRRFAEVGDEWRPGDVVIHNHAYYGASHQPDVGFCVPIFHGDELVGFSATTAHHLDLGALTPGTCGIVDAGDAYAEGLQFAAIKVEEEGRRNEAVWRLIADNVRAPHLVVGDMAAQVAAAKLGAARFLELVERYGLATVRAAAEDLMDYSDRLMRGQIERLPDGVYAAEGRLDGFADQSDPAVRDLRIAVAVTVAGSDIRVDLTGTSPQVDLPINMPFQGTVDIAVWVTLRSILLDAATHDPVPTNSGLFRAISIAAPEGCLANPRFPAPTIARFCSGNLVADTLMRALAPILPQAVSAGVGNLKVVAYSGLRDGRQWVHMDIHEASYGGRFGSDGLDAVDTLYANTRNNPIEDVESHLPLRVTQYELIEDGGGPGRWRGGLGTVREVEFLDAAGYSLEGEGSVWAPPGLFGGGAGAPGAVWVNRGGDGAVQLPSKFPYRRAAAGDRLCLISPCGGGYGAPSERDPDAVRRDVAEGYVSRESARSVYGLEE